MPEINELSGAFSTSNPFLAQLHQEADNIQAYMVQRADILDPASLTDRLSHLDVYMARLTDMMIRSKAMRERAKHSYVNSNEDRLNKMTATVSNRLIEANLQEYTAAYNRLDAMYHTIEHLTRDLVTQISYIKK
jgi:hypothetical protein